MQSMTIIEILILLFPFIIWVIGITKRIPVLITLAGILLCIIPFYFGFPTWLIILLVMLGCALILGSAIQGMQ